MPKRLPTLTFALVAIMCGTASYTVSGRIAPTLVAPDPALDDDGYPGASVTRAGPALMVEGLLVAKTLQRLRKEFAQAPVETVNLWSGGGLAPAATAIATLLNRHGTHLAIGPGAVCSSACVILLAETRPDLRDLDSSAILRVHGGSKGPGDPREAETSTDGMGPWVRTFSGPWFDYLSGCRSRPLIRNAGLAMSWGEIQAIEQGHNIDCGRIAYRTKDWLFSRFLPPSLVRLAGASQAR